MTQVTPTIAYYAYLNDEWVELNWAADPVKVKQGMNSNDPDSRIATVGRLTFMLNNNDNIYTPGHASAITGWKNGVKIKQVISYGGYDYPSRWHIEPLRGIQIDARENGTRKASITALDWMDYAAKENVGMVSVLDDFTADLVIESVVEAMAQPPENMELDTGVNVFGTTLDATGENAKVYAELAKIALSDGGYIYIRPDGGEALYFDSYHSRNGLSTESPIVTSNYGDSITSKTFYETDVVFDAEVNNGNNIINSAKIYAYPRKRETSAVILFTLSEPILLASGQTFILNGSYTNPDGGAPCNGFDMVDPVATTDYTANSESDGSGTDRTSNLSVSPWYGAAQFSHAITNNYAGNVWLTSFKCRGKGIYLQNQINYVAKDTDSIDEIGEVQKTINQKYQTTLAFPETMAENILFFDKEPETRIDSISFCANRSDESMKAFLQLGIGDMIRITSDKGGVDAYHYIQGVEYEILPGRIIMVKWITKQFLSLALGLSLLGCSFGSCSSKDMIDYGVVPQVSGLDEITVSAWVYVTQYYSSYVVSNFSDASGWAFFVSSTYPGAISFYQKGASGPGSWATDAGVVPLNTWTHIAVTRDTTDPANEPVFYVNGSVESTTEYNAQSGATIDETGSHLMVGNVLTATYDYERPFYGYILGPRIYNEIINSTDIGLIYAAGRWDTDTVTSALVWQGGCFRSKDTDLFNGANYLDDNTRTIDNIFRTVGKGHHYPTPFTDTSSPEYIESLLHFDYQNGTGNATLLDNGLTDISSNITVPVGTDLIVFATRGDAPILGGVTASLAVIENRSGHYGAIYYIVSPSSGSQTLTGSKAYWWAVEDSSGILIATDTAGGANTLKLTLETAGQNLTFCHVNDYSDGNLEVTQSYITEDYDSSYDGKTELNGHYNDTVTGDIDITITGVKSIPRGVAVAASFGFSSVDNIIDETGKTWTISGTATLAETPKKFGTGALLLDGSGYIYSADSADWVLGADDWTFDFWLNFSDENGSAFSAFFSQYEDANNLFYIRYSTSGKTIRCRMLETTSVWDFTAPFNPSESTWYHIAVVRSGNTPYVFINGVSQTVTESTTIAGKTAGDLSGTVQIGAMNGTTRLYGSIDEFRFSSGVARWTDDFTPPTCKYSS